MKRAAAGMLSLGLSYDELFTSPYLRATQTAEIVAQALNGSERYQLSATLAPDGDAKQFIGQLHDEDHGQQSIMLVGHAPYLNRLISTLLAGHPNLPVIMKKGSLCALQIDTLRFGRCARLLWLLTPRQLRALA